MTLIVIGKMSESGKKMEIELNIEWKKIWPNLFPDVQGPRNHVVGEEGRVEGAVEFRVDGVEFSGGQVLVEGRRAVLERARIFRLKGRSRRATVAVRLQRHRCPLRLAMSKRTKNYQLNPVKPS